MKRLGLEVHAQDHERGHIIFTNATTITAAEGEVFDIIETTDGMFCHRYLNYSTRFYHTFHEALESAYQLIKNTRKAS